MLAPPLHDSLYTMDDVEFQMLAAPFHIICLAESTDLRAFMDCFASATYSICVWASGVVMSLLGR